MTEKPPENNEETIGADAELTNLELLEDLVFTKIGKEELRDLERRGCEVTVGRDGFGEIKTVMVRDQGGELIFFEDIRNLSKLSKNKIVN